MTPPKQSTADAYDAHKEYENREELESHLLSPEAQAKDKKIFDKSIENQKATDELHAIDKAISNEDVQKSLAADRQKAADIINAAVNEQSSTLSTKEKLELLELHEAIDHYEDLKTKSQEIEKKLTKYKEIIFSAVKPGETSTANTFAVFVKPGTKRFSYYSDTQKVLATIIESDIPVIDCITFNRATINEHIKDGSLPKSLQALEETKTISPTLVFSSANTWEDENGN